MTDGAEGGRGVTEGQPRSLKGRTVVITGASSGIGAEAARRFGELGAVVAVVGRSPEKTAAVARRIGGRAYPADYTRLDDVRRRAAELSAAYERIDVLANNAGGLFTSRKTTPDGHEMTFQVNRLRPEEPANDQARDADLARRLCERSADMTGLADPAATGDAPSGEPSAP
jgi:NAD(P)-dependent dehydrogenase (short-subunit alcohol dehydrogenase family)